MTRTVLISGAGIAGPALAYWLHHHGFRPVVVERAEVVRTGGYPIDVRAAAIEVARRMDLLPALRAAHIGSRQVRFVDHHGRTTGRLTPEQFTGGPEGRDVELPRGTLAHLLYERTRDDVEYLFGDRVTGLEERADGVHVTFGTGPPRTVDLVVGADGLHSTVRALAFGPESRFRHDLGYAFAGFSTDIPRHDLDREALLHNTPGRLAGYYAVRGQRAPTGMLAFATPPGFAFDPHNHEQQRDLVAAAFADGAWEVPQLVTAMRAADDFFFDSVSQIRMPRWTAGRVALVGDAAYAPALLSGQGSSLALIGAYVLADELAAAGGDAAVAFPAYERTLRPFVERNQALATSGGATLIPTTRVGLWLRDRLLAVLPHLGVARRLLTGRIDEAARSFPLPARSPQA